MMLVRLIIGCTLGFSASIGWTAVAAAQVPPSAAESANYTGLLAAAARGDVAGIRALVARGEKPDVKDGHGRTPLHVAVYGRHHDAMRALTVAGANPNLADRTGQTPLSLARARGYDTMARLLQSAGAR